jgi:hypothetical protein
MATQKLIIHRADPPELPGTALHRMDQKVGPLLFYGPDFRVL